MLLALDIGNSDITIGLHDSTHWRHIWRMPSGNLTEVYYGLKLQNFFLEAGLRTDQINRVIISSVVPDLSDILMQVTSTLFGVKPLQVAVPLYGNLPVKVMNPYEIGADLVANAVAAFSLFQNACVVVDFGTALTFTVINSNGEIIGVAIAPGLKTAVKALSQNTAKLFDVPLEYPSSVLGRNTVHAIQAGLLYGYEGMVERILSRVKEELKSDVSTVATGGLSSIIPGLSTRVDMIIPTLTLDGLRIIHDCIRPT
jgi:type III pantothenate kinase